MRQTRETNQILYGVKRVIFFLLFAAGCTQAEVEETNTQNATGAGNIETTFHFEVSDSQAPVTRSITFMAQGSTETDTLSVGEATSVADTLQTRAATELPDEQEKKVANLWIGQYNAAGTTLLSHQYIESVIGTQVTAKLVATTGNCHVRFVANAGNLGAIETETLLDAKTLAYASTADGRPQSNLFAMTGEWTGNITGTTPPQTIPSVTLTRLAAKITFTYKINGEGFTFTPTAVSLKNVPNCSQIGTLSPGNRPASATYTTSYNGTTSKIGATMYWYLPENMAGTGNPSVSTEKEKKGDGVTNATYIELLGDAIQNGVPYTDVAFRFYPGRDENDYNIERNDHFIMSIDLRGLDISDKRITVGTIPAITVSPGNLSAAAGGTKDVQITSRAGTIWSLPLPSWLSATIDGQITPGGSTLTNQGPCKVTFKTTEVNPNSEAREQPFAVNLDEKGTQGSFTLTQDPSTFTVSPSTVDLGYEEGATDSVTVNGTPGLAWTVSPSVEMNGIRPLIINNTTNGTNQVIEFAAQENIGAPRTGAFYITVPGSDHEKTVKVTQKANPILTINQEMLAVYVVWSAGWGDLTVWPPFDVDGDGGQAIKDKHPSVGFTPGAPTTMTGYYQVQVQSTQSADAYNYQQAQDYCTSLDVDSHSDWRLPTQIELYVMWYKAKGTFPPGNAGDTEPDSYIYGVPPIPWTYWTSSVYNSNSGYRCLVDFLNGGFNPYGDKTNDGINVRCVRDLN